VKLFRALEELYQILIGQNLLALSSHEIVSRSGIKRARLVNQIIVKIFEKKGCQAGENFN
jgi:hypothetical protein